MTNYKYDFEEVPNSGWGVNSKDSIDTGRIPIWDEDDIDLVDFTDREKAAFNARKESRKYPSRLRAYGLWNVSEAQLLDSTWTPIPYRMLDEACMLFVIVLCPIGATRGRYWPLNFDLNERPKSSREQMGFGVHCHQGIRNPRTSGLAFQTETETFLVWKRFHIFGGSEVSSLVVMEGGRRNRDVRMSSSSADPNSWTYGTQFVSEKIIGTDDGQDHRLHFYFAVSGPSNDSEWAYECEGVNLRGHWFDVMREANTFPSLPSQALNRETPSSPSQTLHLTTLSDSEYMDRSRSSHEPETVMVPGSMSSAGARRRVINPGDNYEARASVINRKVSYHRHSTHPDVTTGNTHSFFGLQSSKPQRTIFKATSSSGGLIDSSFRIAATSTSTIQNLGQAKGTAGAVHTVDEQSRKKPRIDTGGAGRWQVEDQRSVNLGETRKTQHEAKSLMEFFFQFDDDYSEVSQADAIPSGTKPKLKSLVINSVVAPWKTEQTGLSCVELQQARAAEGYQRVTTESQEMVNQLAATKALALAQQQAIND